MAGSHLMDDDADLVVVATGRLGSKILQIGDSGSLEGCLVQQARVVPIDVAGVNPEATCDVGDVGHGVASYQPNARGPKRIHPNGPQKRWGRKSAAGATMCANKLTRFQEKRDFKRTAEAAGNDKVVVSDALRFVIQKHAASHLPVPALMARLSAWEDYFESERPLAEAIRRLGKV